MPRSPLRFPLQHAGAVPTRRGGAALVLFALCAVCTTTGAATAPEDTATERLITAAGEQRPGALTTQDFTGRGVFEFGDGDRYEGEFENGLPSGKGRLTRADGSVYEGDWRAGRRHGRGRLVLPDDGGTYEGDFRDDRRQGLGRFTSGRGTYEGQWYDDLPQGRGRFEYADGNRYEGEWLRGNRHGWGIFEQPGGSRYEGEWRNDAPHGFGRLDAADGHSLDGEWERGQFAGYGTYEDRRGIVYEGTWEQGQRDGWGREAWPNGSVYEGGFSGNVRAGRGTWRSGDGEGYSGQWRDGEPAGPGTRTVTGGIMLTGDWSGNRLESGRVTLPGGAVYDGPLLASEAPERMAPAYVGWLEDLARSGDGHARYLLADAYASGRAGTKDADRARTLLAQAAADGVVPALVAHAQTLLAEGRADKGLAQLRQAAEAGSTQAHIILGTFAQTGEHRPMDHLEALAHYRTAATTGNLTAQNNLAWLLATSPDKDVRNGPQAIEIMRPLVHFVNDWGYYDTLAAAYAESGAFASAMEWQERAIEAAGSDAPTEIMDQMMERLELYRGDRPYREP